MRRGAMCSIARHIDLTSAIFLFFCCTQLADWAEAAIANREWLHVQALRRPRDSLRQRPDDATRRHLSGAARGWLTIISRVSDVYSPDL